MSTVACNKVTYVNPSTTPNGRIVEESGSYFLLGLAGSKEIYANQVCPEGLARVQSRFTFVDMLLTIVTVTIYSPRTYAMHCGVKAAAQ